MLVLSRKLGEKIFIGGNITIVIVDIDRGKIRLGIEAPKDVTILRSELMPIDRPRLPAIVSPTEPAPQTRERTVHPWPTI